MNFVILNIKSVLKNYIESKSKKNESSFLNVMKQEQKILGIRKEDVKKFMKQAKKMKKNF